MRLAAQEGQVLACILEEVAQEDVVPVMHISQCRLAGHERQACDRQVHGAHLLGFLSSFASRLRERAYRGTKMRSASRAHCTRRGLPRHCRGASGCSQELL